ncbi:hypothetical protein OIK40_13430 [Erythrobacter sp. sf7]|uniref:Lipoprotein n=1 Tax=Erythrobacter fulvus TaxID=2987523 RepID=A0ABT5JT23_9SPHN|nr:hypothetical protein [Erythrobacter fulvus]MDC8755646.1 hypothetical protein [Erythrobacter fulvus]
MRDYAKNFLIAATVLLAACDGGNSGADAAVDEPTSSGVDVAGFFETTKTCEEQEFLDSLIAVHPLEGGIGFRNLVLGSVKIDQIIELKRTETTAICSGRVSYSYGSDPEYTISMEEDQTWKVETTTDGLNYFTWRKGRHPASAFE